MHHPKDVRDAVISNEEWPRPSAVVLASGAFFGGVARETVSSFTRGLPPPPTAAGAITGVIGLWLIAGAGQ